jgi:hypothetical protein
MSANDTEDLDNFLSRLTSRTGERLRSTDWKGGSDRVKSQVFFIICNWLATISGNTSSNIEELIRISCSPWLYCSDVLQSSFLTTCGMGMGHCLTWLSISVVNLVALVLAHVDEWLPGWLTGTYPWTKVAENIRRALRKLAGKSRVCGDDALAALTADQSGGYSSWLVRFGAMVHPLKDLYSARAGVFVGNPIVTKRNQYTGERTISAISSIDWGALIGDTPGWVGAGAGVVSALRRIPWGTRKHRHAVLMSRWFHGKLRKRWHDHGIQPDLPVWLGGAGFATHVPWSKVLQKSRWWYKAGVLVLSRLLSGARRDGREGLATAASLLSLFSSQWKVATGDWSTADAVLVAELFDYMDDDDVSTVPKKGYSSMTDTLASLHGRLAVGCWLRRGRGPSVTERIPRLGHLARVIRSKLIDLARSHRDLRIRMDYAELPQQALRGLPRKAQRLIHAFAGTRNRVPRFNLLRPERLVKRVLVLAQGLHLRDEVFESISALDLRRSPKGAKEGSPCA